MRLLALGLLNGCFFAFTLLFGRLSFFYWFIFLSSLLFGLSHWLLHFLSWLFFALFWLLRLLSCTIERTLYHLSSTIVADRNFASQVTIRKISTKCDRLSFVDESELLGFLDGTIRFAIDELGLLALNLSATSLVVCALLKLIVFEGALIKVSIAEVETTLHQIIVEHKAIEEAAIFPILLGLARLLAICNLASEAILRVIAVCLSSDSLHLGGALLRVVAQELSFFLLEFLDCI